MFVKILDNGNLAMAASSQNERDELVKFLMKDHNGIFVISPVVAETQFVAEYLNDPMVDGISYRQIKPEDAGALTDATIITDAPEGELNQGINVWGYMNYQIENFLELLVAGRTIYWQKG